MTCPEKNGAALKINLIKSNMLVTELKIGGYKFEEPTHYGTLHLGVDYSAKFIPIEYPIDLKDVIYTNGKQGGLTIEGVDELGYIHRFLHLDEFKTNASTIPKGMLFAITGASGNLGSKNGHLHRDIRKPNTRHLPLNIKNFIDPEIYDKEILPNLLNMIPQWFKDNGTDKWAKDKMIRIDQTNLTETDCKELESLKKATQPADIEVTTIITKELSKDELRAYKLSLREVTKFFDGYVNLMFKEPEIRSMSLELVKDRINYLPSKGLNVILYPDKEVDKMKGNNVNGFMVVNQRTTVIAREVLLREDSKHRSEYHYAATLSHELTHWFGAMLDFETRQDRTHYFDYEFTLANYLPKLAWSLLHDKNFRTNNGL